MNQALVGSDLGDRTSNPTGLELSREVWGGGHSEDSW